MKHPHCHYAVGIRLRQRKSPLDARPDVTSNTGVHHFSDVGLMACLFGSSLPQITIHAHGEDYLWTQLPRKVHY